MKSGTAYAKENSPNCLLIKNRVVEFGKSIKIFWRAGMASVFRPQATRQVKASKPSSRRFESSALKTYRTSMRTSPRSVSPKASKLYSANRNCRWASIQARALDPGVTHHQQGGVAIASKRHPFGTVLSCKEIQKTESRPANISHAVSSFIQHVSFQEDALPIDSRLSFCRVGVSPNRCIEPVQTTHSACQRLNR